MDEIIEILSGIHPEIDYETEDALIDKRIFDSFDIVTLVGELTDNYDIEIGPEELIPENFNSAAGIYALVTRLMEE
ncbi:MAG: acyl carrier protein [Lachnospiraceae bacterium]|nr:acyl carrier protein [Lachnospiraceae bacterium]MBR1876080.1 acyl carrier protein [Lachnospiraceae bacterium]